VAAGGRSFEPVREVVERTVVRMVPVPTAPRPAVRLSGEPYTLPTDAVEWVEALAALRTRAGSTRIYPFREQLARACDRAARALREAEPDRDV
jgi:hypothetical protein